MEKRGELTTTQIVTLIILIASFAIILIFIFVLDLGGEEKKEICHNSVLISGKSKGLAGNVDCTTNYVCISGGEDCEGFSFDVKEKVDLQIDEVMRKIAEEMTDCWWMFGEGKVDYGNVGDSSVKYAVCSTIKFDKDIESKFFEISYKEFYEFLESEKFSDTETFFSYIYGIVEIENLEFEEGFDINVEENVIDFSKRYSAVTGLDDNVVEDTEIFKVYLVPTNELSSRLTASNKEFITKS